MTDANVVNKKQIWNGDPFISQQLLRIKYTRRGDSV